MKAEAYIDQLPMWAREKNSLKDVRRYLEYLGNPDRNIPIIHVAGTNGKGSVCAYLTWALLHAGYHVGTFISPHLVDIRERFLLDGKMAEESLFEESFQKVKAAADVLTKQSLCHPTYFEFLFHMAAIMFAEQKVDFWVMETGMGGRLDTTNVTEHPLISIITSVSLEHTRYLGSTIQEIAGEKAGIIKEGVPVVFDANHAQAAQVIRQTAEMRHAPAYPVSRSELLLNRDERGQLWMSFKKDGRMREEAGSAQTAENRERFIRIPFPAPYQADNGALAWKALQILMESGVLPKEKAECFRQGMEKTVWPGRMEQVQPGVFLDGAHNPDGIRVFGEAAGELCAERKTNGIHGRILVLFAVVEDKDYREMVQDLCSHLKPDLAAVTHVHSDRGLSEDTLADCFLQAGCPARRFDEAADALSFLLKEKREEDLLFCVGSLYLIGEIKKIFLTVQETDQNVI